MLFNASVTGSFSEGLPSEDETYENCLSPVFALNGSLPITSTGSNFVTFANPLLATSCAVLAKTSTSSLGFMPGLGRLKLGKVGAAAGV